REPTERTQDPEPRIEQGSVGQGNADPAVDLAEHAVSSRDPRGIVSLLDRDPYPARLPDVPAGAGNNAPPQRLFGLRQVDQEVEMGLVPEPAGCERGSEIPGVDRVAELGEESGAGTLPLIRAQQGLEDRPLTRSPRHERAGERYDPGRQRPERTAERGDRDRRQEGVDGPVLA